MITKPNRPVTNGGDVRTPATSFRLHEEVIKAMDRLLKNPPALLFDDLRGAARNRTELIEVLVKRALEAQAAESAKGKKKG